MSDIPEKPALRIVKPIPHIKPRKLPIALKRAASEAAELVVPNKALPTPKKNYVVNRVTEYGALFNRLNEERIAKKKPPLKTAMEILIEAMQSKEIDLKDKAKIAEKRIIQHLNSWIVESDFAWLASQNVNLVRIPLGYWNVIEDPYNMYVPIDPATSFGYIDQAFYLAVANARPAGDYPALAV